MLDITKPLQLSDGTPVNIVKRSRLGYTVIPAKGYQVTVGDFVYDSRNGTGGYMEFRDDNLKHVCSDLTLENVKAPTLDLTKPVQTRDGRRAYHLAHRAEAHPDYLFFDVEYVKGCWGPSSRWLDGREYSSDKLSDDDIINVPEIVVYGDTLTNSGDGVNVTKVDGIITKVELV